MGLKRAGHSEILVTLLLILGSSTAPAVPAQGGDGSRGPQHSATQLQGRKRSLQQLGRPWIHNGGSWPAGFSDLDKAVETQRIFRAVLSERNRTTYASKYPDIAWRNWQRRYNVTYTNETEAAYRRRIFDYNLALAKQLNELAGPDVAFGINRFSVLTQDEFLASFTGDVQDDSGITVSENHPQLVASPAAAVIAAMKMAADAAANASVAQNGSTTQNGSSLQPGGPAGDGGGGGITPPVGDGGPPPDDGGGGGGVPPGPGGGGNAPAWVNEGSSASRVQGLQLLRQEAADFSSSIGGGGDLGEHSSDPGGRRLHQVQLQLLQADGLEEEQQELKQLEVEQGQHQSKGWWQWLLEALGLKSMQQPQQRQQRQQQHTQMLLTSMATRRLQQQILPSGPFAPEPFCSKQVPFPYSRLLPFKTVDWLRAGAVRGPKAQPSNCSNSFAFVAAALAESTMAMQGYNGTAQDISEQQLMECFPGSSCSRGGTVHVLLNYLACNGVAATGSSYSGPSFGTYPSSTGTSADFSGKCANGSYQPVQTGITGWAWVPNNEFALGQALSRTPAKVSVDASVLQTYRAGYLGCNIVSQIANHAMMLVGYNNQVRAGPPPAGSAQNFTFFNSTEYWMLKNSWGNYGSVDGFVYITKGCPKATPLGMLVNRGVIPTWNQSESYKIGRLECKNETQVNDNCSKELLLQLAGYCAGVDDYMPAPQNNSCACSCIPT